APATADLPDEIYSVSTVHCLNEPEAAVLANRSVTSLIDAEAVGRVLLKRGAKNVLITLGARGCLLVNAGKLVAIPAPQITAIDTTGAGDAFIGSLAFDLARDRGLEEAAGRACRIAAISVQFAGTQTSFP